MCLQKFFDLMLSLSLNPNLEFLLFYLLPDFILTLEITVEK